MKIHLFSFRKNLLHQVLSFEWLIACLILILHLTVTTKTCAQNKLWDKTIGGNGEDILRSFQQTSDGGYILGGTSDSGKSGDKSQNNKGWGYGGNGDYWVVKLRANGSKEWDKTFGGKGTDKLVSLQQTMDGGYILGGTSWSGKSTDKTEAKTGAWLVKLNAKGIKVWDKTFRETNWTEFSFDLLSMQQTADDGFILSMRMWISGAEECCWQYWIFKLSANGGKEWDKFMSSYPDPGRLTPKIEQTADGGYIYSGTAGSDDNFDDYWIVKLNGDGSQAWDKKLGGNLFEELICVQQTRDGGYILGGISNSSISGDKTEANKGENNSSYPSNDYWIVRLDATGKKVWDKTLGGNKADLLTFLHQTQDGGHIVGGWSISDKSGNKSETSKDSIIATEPSADYPGDYWVIKLQEDGTKEWDRTIGANSKDELAFVQQTSDGNYILGGTSDSKKSGDKSSESKGGENVNGLPAGDFWIVKLSNTGLISDQTITFSPILNKTYGDAPFTLMAKATSSLPVSFKVVSGPATVQRNILTLTGIGKVTIKAFQKGNEAYKAADTTQTFEVEAPSILKKVWDKTFGGNKEDALISVQQTSDGGYLLAGSSHSQNSGDKTTSKKGIWIVKVKADGSKEWDKSLNITGGGISIVQQISDGGYILGGYPEDGDNYPIGDYWVIKLNADGSQMWNKTFGGNDGDGLTSVQQTRDGGYILGGSSYSDAGGDKTEENRGGSDEDTYGLSDYWIIKLDPNGNKEWDKTLGGNGYDDLSSIQQTRDGGYILGGSSSSAISGEKSQANRGSYYSEDYWLVKIQADGTKEWDKTFGGDEFEFLNTLQQTQDGGYILGGYSESGISGDKSEASRNKEGETRGDYWIVKVNADGSKEWDKTLGGFDNDWLESVQQTSDGGYILGGSSSSENNGDKTQIGRGGGDYWIVKLNAKGTKEWDKTLGGGDMDVLISVQQTQDGGYILGGNSYSGIGGDKSEKSRDEFSEDYYFVKGDYWIIKLKEELPLTTSWNMRYGGYGNDNLTTVIKTNDGGYLSGGYSNSSNSGDKTKSSQGKNDYWIVKSDKNGKKIWDKSFGGSGDDYLNRIIQTQDGGYLLGGSSLSGKTGDKTEASKGNRDYWLVKIDKLGNKEWDKTYGGSGYDELTKVIQLASGEYVLGGHSNSPATRDKTQGTRGGNDYWLVKITNKGEKLWDKRYGGRESEQMNSFIETADGGFLLGGSSLSSKSGDKGENSRGISDYWVLKTDKDGILVWEKTFGGSGEDEIYSVRQIAGNNYYLAGTSNSSKGGDKSQESQGGNDYWLIKLNESGTNIWDKTFGGNKDDKLLASTFTNKDHYILAGSSNSDVSGDKSQPGQGSSDYWIIDVDGYGNKVSDQRIGGSGEDELRTVTTTKDGGLLLGGRSISGASGDRTQPSQGGTDYWLVKVTPANTTIVAVRSTTLPEELIVNSEFTTFVAYPNPSSDKVTINFTLPQTQAVSLKVLNSQGQEVQTLFQAEAQAKQTYQLEWQARKQTAGMYLLQLQTPTKQSIQKILLTK